MCGIAGFTLNQQHQDRDWKELRQLYKTFLTFTQARGTDATGIAIVRENHDRPIIHKSPLPAYEYVAREDTQRVLSLIKPGVIQVLGHTRAATQGNPKNPNNNHPIETGRIVGVHNGWVCNDDDVMSIANKKRIGECDSEAIFKLLDVFTGSDWTKTAIQDAMKVIMGSWSIAVVNLSKPRTTLLARGDMPLFTAYDPKLGVLWFGSLPEYLQATYALLDKPRTIEAEIVAPSTGVILTPGAIPPRTTDYFPLIVSPGQKITTRSIYNWYDYDYYNQIQAATTATLEPARKKKRRKKKKKGKWHTLYNS